MDNSAWFGVAALLAIAGLAVVLFLRRRVSVQGPLAELATRPGDSIVTRNRIVFGAADRPLLDIFDQQFLDQRKCEDLPLTPKIQAGLQNLLPRLPVMGTAVAIAASQTYVLQFAPEVAKGLANGTLTMMRSGMVEGGIRASAVDANRTIVGNASLAGASGINVAAASIVAWQLLAFVTAQRYLVDINSRLDAIEKEVCSLIELMENERLGKLLGNLRILQSRAKDLFEDDMSEAQALVYTTELRDIDRECTQIKLALLRQFESETRTFANQSFDGGLFSVEDAGVKARQGITSAENTVRQCLLATYIRVVVHQCLCAIPIGRHSVNREICRIHEEHGQFRDPIEEFWSMVEKRVPQLKSTLTRTSTDAKHRQQLKEHIKTSLEGLLGVWQDIDDLARRTKEALHIEMADDAPPLTLAATIDSGGTVTRLQRVIAER